MSTVVFDAEKPQSPRPRRMESSPMPRPPVAVATAATKVGLVVERVTLEDLEGIETEWRALAERALEPNPFLEPAFFVPAAHHIQNEGKPTPFLVWEVAEGGRRRLVGFFAIVLPGRSIGATSARSWTHDYSPSGIPLIDRDRAPAVLAAFMRQMSATRRAIGGVIFPGLDRDGPFATLLARFASEQRVVVNVLERSRRAVLRGGADPERFADETLRHKKFKELKRLRRRLGEMGTLTSRSVRDRKGVREAFEHHLALEASGWKGRAGTAMMIDPAIAAFARAATRSLAGAKSVRVDMLELDGRPIATGIVIESGDRAFYWKTAFDESLARFSPGVQLTLDITARQLGRKRIALTDSCAIEGHPMIDHLWADRIEVVDLLVGLEERRTPATLAVAARERLARRVHRGLKSALFRFTGRKWS